MGLVSIQRFVIECGHHLSHRFSSIWAGDHRRPSLFSCRLKFGSEAFPLHLEVFICPGNLNLPSRKIGPVFTNISDTKGEAPPHCLADFLFNFCLGFLAIRPIGLKDFLPVNDFHESTPFAVTSPPNRIERIPGLNPPGGCGNMIRNLYAKAFGFRIENENRQKTFDFFSKTIPRLQDCTVRTLLQCEGEFLIPFAIGGEFLDGDHFAQFPGTGIGKIGFGFVPTTHSTPVVRGVKWLTKPGSFHLFGFLEPKNI